LKMLLLCMLRDESIVAEENTEITIAEVRRKSSRRGITAAEVEKIAPLPPNVRKEKVLAVRQRLAEGKYNISERLDAILDRILKDLSN